MTCGYELTNGVCQDCEMPKDEETDEVEDKRLPVVWYRIIMAMLVRMLE